MSGHEYEKFISKVEGRPEGMSPAMFVARMANRPALASEWLIRWTREQRETEDARKKLGGAMSSETKAVERAQEHLRRRGIRLHHSVVPEILEASGLIAERNEYRERLAVAGNAWEAERRRHGVERDEWKTRALAAETRVGELVLGRDYLLSKVRAYEQATRSK